MILNSNSIHYMHVLSASYHVSLMIVSWSFTLNSNKVVPVLQYLFSSPCTGTETGAQVVQSV